ncbi:MAG: PorV/PorQ family protein, partial [Candidatus Eiseniibacteriota bacterium]
MSPRGSSGRMRGLGVASACAFACALGFGLGAGAPQARAAEDGGTQSVFAYGAGNRALAMGTAFVATADDASAVLWNPAGLGRLPRAELQGVQSLELGFGVTESYVAVALPNWRWGTGGLVFRHFGVGDIDARDARNVPLGGEIKDSEIEVALGYGRALNDTWSLGGAVKLQHQSLAGYSGSGLGVDLGVHARPASLIGLRAPWADGLRWGLSLRNAVAPAIRLDQESVSDPFSWRSGLAWQTVTPGGQGFLAEIDVSKAASTNPNLCAGLEFRLHPAAAMRLGMNDGMFTAGVGLQLRDVSVEYAFENQEIATSHRAGVRFQFGATTEESRLAELRREDEQVERRLAEAFQERQKEQVAGMLERANAAQVRGELDEALGILALLDTLEPGHPEARALQIAILKEKARRLEEGEEFASAAIVWSEALALAPADSSVALGIARCREESDRRARRTNEIRVRFAQAMDAFAAGELERARADFRAVLDVDAADREARRMLERTEQALARRALESARRTAEAARAEHATT